jgi:microsomal epoxide hydrolase
LRNAPEDRALDIRSVIAGLHLRHVSLVGWSQGAQDVAAYVDQVGTSEVDTFVLVDSPVSSGPADVAENPAFVKTILRGLRNYHTDPAAYTDGMMHSIITAATPKAVFDHLNQEAARTPTDVGISMLVQDVFTTDRRPALKKFDKPTLVIASADSRLLDEQKAMAKALPAGHFTAIDHAAHAVFFDQPQKFDQQLDDFIKSSTVSAGHG